MSTQAVSGSSIYQELQSFYQNRQSDVQALGDALQSGDLNAAQQAYSQLASLGQGGPFGNAEPFNRADRAQDFEAVGQALSSGDLAGAQAAFAQLQQTFGHRNHIGAQAPPAFFVTLSVSQSTAETAATSSSESIYQQLQDFRFERKSDLQQLGQALGSGDLNAAQQAYDTLVQLGQQGPFSNSEPFRRSDRAQAFEAIGQALQSGDLAGAQQAFAALESTFGTHNHHGGTEPPTFGGGTTPPKEPPVFQPPSTVPPPSSGPPTEPPVYGGGTTPPTEPPVFRPPSTVPPIITSPPTEPPVYGGGTTPPTEPPVFEPPSTVPPIVSSPPTEPPVYGGGTTTNFSEIVINIGGAGSAASQNTSGSELVVNLPSPSASSPEQVQINLSGSNGSAEQLTIEVGQVQGQNGQTSEQIAINLTQAVNESIILNLFGDGSSTQSPTQSSPLNVQG